MNRLNQWRNQFQARLTTQQSPWAANPYHRFQSVAELQAAAAAGVRIDVNRADVDDWLRLPGVSIHQAKLLVSLRQSGVQFHCLDDLAAALNLSVERLKSLEPILLFCYYDPTGLETIQRIPVNLASEQMLTQIPAIDLFLARAIVKNRQVGGKYANLPDLQRRLNLPPQLTAKLMHYLAF